MAQHVAGNPECLITKVHMYPLGGLRKSAAWSYAVMEGDITLKSGNKGFKINRDID